MGNMILGNNTTQFKVGSTDVDAIYLGNTLVYSPTPPTPTGSTCYEVISTPITSYTSTTYDSVYSFSDTKWYIKNNLSQYEEYGVYDVSGSSLSDYTYYEGKLVAIGTTEYQRSGNTWVEVGTYEDSSVTYTIDDSDPYAYQGQTLSTTFKIPTADIEALGGWFYMDIFISDGGHLDVSYDQYTYYGSSSEQGTVTSDADYYYYSLPTTQSVVIDSIEYMEPRPIHLIVGSKQATVEYVEKATPSYSTYSTVQEMESVGCPTVGINEYAFVGNDLYKYFANEEWNGVTYFEPKMVAFYENEDPLIQYVNNNSTLEQSETKIRGISPISVYIGDNVTSIGEKAFWDDSYPYNNAITSVTFSENSQLASIGNNAFENCSSLTSIDIPSGVTSLGNGAFYGCSSLTSITIPSGVTSIGNYAFNTCSGLTSITCLATTPPTMSGTAFNNTNNCPIYVPSQSVETYKAASGWSTYASRIQAIPNS